MIITPILIAGIIYGVYKLHVKGIIHVRIPKPFRIFCFKNYISPEEIEEMRRLEEFQKKCELQKQLNIRTAVKPNNKGYKLDDSYFSDHDYHPEKIKRW